MDNGIRRGKTTPVPDELIDYWLPQLSLAELRVYLYVCRRTLAFAKDLDAISLTQFARGITRKSGQTLDGGTGLSESAVKRAIRSLIEKGCIEKVNRKDPSDQRVDLLAQYSIRFPSLGTRPTEGGVRSGPPGGDKENPLGATSEPQGGDAANPRGANSAPKGGAVVAPTRNREQETEHLSSADADTPTGEPDPEIPVTQRFAALWDSSPRRGSRKQSLDRYRRIVKREPAAADEIERGLTRAKRSDQWLGSVLDPKSDDAPGSYIVHFERFISDERWRDDVTWPPYTRRRLSDDDVEDIWESFRGRDRKAVDAKPQPEPEPAIQFSAADAALITEARKCRDADLVAAYDRVVEHFRALFASSESFPNWIEPLDLIGRAGRTVVIEAPTRAVRQWVEDEYVSDIRRLLGCPVRIVVPGRDPCRRRMSTPNES